MSSSGDRRRWSRLWRLAAAALLFFLGVVTLSVGLVALAAGVGTLVATNGGESLLVVGAVVVAGALLLMGIGAALRPVEPPAGPEAEAAEPEAPPEPERPADASDSSPRDPESRSR